MRYLLTIFLLLTMVNFNKGEMINTTGTESLDVDITQLSFSLVNLNYVMDKLGIKHKDIVMSQMILETGHGTSYGFRIRNNLFGFFYKGKYLIFNNWQGSVQYYKNWQDRHYKGGDYYQFLEDRGYAEDPNYCKKLRVICKQLGDSKE